MNPSSSIYAILCNPGHNRVYFKASLKMAESELEIASQKLSVRLANIENRQIAGIDYLTFTVEAPQPPADAGHLSAEAGFLSAEAELSPTDIEIISGLSFVFAIYEAFECGGVECLRPVARTNREFIDGSVSSILKYTGKTNEIFTRMMINVALYSRGTALSKPDDKTDRGHAAPLNLLDPVAGKGTTLYEGLIQGLNVYGIEIGDKIVAEAYHYIKKFLETERYKHKAETHKISGANKSFQSMKYTFEIAKSKEDAKSNDVRVLEIISGNSANAGQYYKKNFFDMIVGDLPYGVQHGNVTNQKQSSLTRNPSELLAACLPAWVDVLKPGGAIVLAWNTNVLPRNSLCQIFAERGFTVKGDPAYLGFGHRVDQSIVRDIIVAVK